MTARRWWSNGEAAVPIPLFGRRSRRVIAEQIGKLLASEEIYTQSRLAVTVAGRRRRPAT